MTQRHGPTMHNILKSFLKPHSKYEFELFKSRDIIGEK